jgi:hypothetical protein
MSFGHPCQKLSRAFRVKFIHVQLKPPVAIGRLVAESIKNLSPEAFLEHFSILFPRYDFGAIQAFDSLPGAIGAGAIIHINVICPFSSLSEAQTNYIYLVPTDSNAMYFEVAFHRLLTGGLKIFSDR